MATSALQFILDVIIAAVDLQWFFMPIIVMSVFALVVRLFLRRYS